MSWSESNTHHWDDWSLADLVAAKQGQRVSLVVPARNEAATVGGLVDKLRTSLMETSDLVDELVVIDSDSSDDTARIAADAGADVYASAAIRPELGSYPGKGEAMWKSQFVTTGELIVFMDADLTDWDTHFVRGLVGPLVNNPTIELVKGFYRRPGEHGLDGGRVTELVARPLLALHRTPLRDLIQPLAGSGRSGARCSSGCGSRPATAWSSPPSSTPWTREGWTRSPRSISASATTATRISSISA